MFFLLLTITFGVMCADFYQNFKGDFKNDRCCNDKC